MNARLLWAMLLGSSAIILVACVLKWAGVATVSSSTVHALMLISTMAAITLAAIRWADRTRQRGS